MARIVVDASAVLVVLLNESHRADVIDATRGAELISPESLPLEVANALSARMKRAGIHRIDIPSAEAAFGAFQQMKIELAALSMADHATALKLAGQWGIYVYDAYMLMTAQSHKATLLTLDGVGQRKGLRQTALSIGVPVAL